MRIDLTILRSCAKHPTRVRRKGMLSVPLALAFLFWCQGYGVLADSSEHFGTIPTSPIAAAQEEQLKADRVEAAEQTKRTKRLRARLAQSGKASWYGPSFQGKATANGDVFDQRLLTAAHKTLPLGSKAKVTNLETGNSVEVTINDRGPFIRGRIIDLSRAAAGELGILKSGVVQVRVEALSGTVG